jgi:L-asparaginase
LPVVLVSSAFPIDDPRANGIKNLHGAVRLIESHQGGGVFVSNRNDDAAILLHRGTRILQQPVCSAAIDSIHNQYYGSIVEDRFVKNPAYRATCGDCLMPLSETVQLRDSAAILRISPCVGMCYPEIPAQTRVILHGSYHSGTLCVREDLHTFAMHAYDREIPFYLTGTTAHEKAYATMERYAALHIQTLPDAAPIAMYCRLWLALSQTSLSIPIWMQTPAGDDGLVCATSHPIKEESL